MRIAVSGAAGRMGRRIVALGHAHPEIEIAAALESPGHPSLGRDAGDLAGVGPLGVLVTDDRTAVLEKCETLVDFSAPHVSVENVKACADAGKAVVVGTTGFTDAQRKEMSATGSRTRFLLAPNMSMGVNLLFSLVERVARALGNNYDVEIVEAHHKMKKDAPSGTAAKLAEIIAHALGRDLSSVGIHGRNGMVGERTSQEIGIMAVRGGDIVGEHTVMFVTEGERIELIHRAHSRDAFARGAIQAALWLAGRPSGVYDMQDVLGLKE
jgi:4-hydroxy-tetrahydrodipicolinate reductase